MSPSQAPAKRLSSAPNTVADGGEVKPVARFPANLIKVCVLGLDPMRASGLRALFDEQSGIEIVVEDSHGSRPGTVWLDPTVQVAVLGAQMGEITSRTIKSLRMARPDLHVLVMSPASGDEAVLSFLALGVKGLVHDSVSKPEFEKAVRVVASGCIWATRQVQSRLIERLLRAGDTNPAGVNATFTKRERDVLGLLLDGRSNREIAASLAIEERTVKAYVTSLMAKVGVKNRIALSMRALSDTGVHS